MRFLTWIICGVALFAAGGCFSGAPLENKEQFLERELSLVASDISGLLTCNPTPVLETCGSAACHSSRADGSPPSGNVDLLEEGFEAALLDVPTSYRNVDDSENCPDEAELLINTDSPQDSLLLKKIRGEQSCGLPMPYIGQLSEEEIECLEAWVLYLAASN